MGKQEAFRILVLIESVYPNFKLKNETVLMWLQFCGNLDFSLIMNKLSVHIRSSPYPPKLEKIACSLSNYQHFLDTEMQGNPSWADEYVLVK